MPASLPSLVGALLVGTLLVSLVACGPGTPTSNESTTPDPPRFELAGCRGIQQHDASLPLLCALKSHRRLHLWLAETPGHEPPTVTGAEVEETRTVDGGILLVLTVLPEVAGIEWQHGGQTTRLAVTTTEPSPWIQEVRQLGRQGALDQARQRLTEGLEAADALSTTPEATARADQSTIDKAELGKALGLLALVEMGLGDPGAAEHALLRAVAHHRASGQLFDEVNDTTRLVFSYLAERRFPEARALLDALPTLDHELAEMAYYRAYYRGVLAEAVGDARNALAWLRQAVDGAARTGLGREQYLAEQVLARVLQGLGRGDEAAAIYVRLRQQPPVDLAACDRAQLLNNQAWALLLAHEAGRSPSTQAETGEPIDLLAAAADELDDPTAAPCAAAERLHLALNRALAELQRGDTAAARRALVTARELDPEPAATLVLWELDLEGRIALAEQRGDDALQRYDRLARLAAQTLAPEAAWRAAVGQARAHQAQGEIDQALARWGEAETLLDQEALAVPLGEGRNTFAAGRELATRRYLSLLLAEDRGEEALAVARRSRARVLRGLRRRDRLAQLSPSEQSAWDEAIAQYRRDREALDQEAAEDWRLPGDQRAAAARDRAARRQALQQTLDGAFAVLGARPDTTLPPLRDDTLTLLYHPTTDGWVGFAARGASVTVHQLPVLEATLGTSPTEELAQQLLGPFADALATAPQVRLLPYGPLRGLDLHALPWQGSVLLDALPVVYGLDLGHGEDPRTSEDHEQPAQGALIVGDPQGNLPAAATEARRVAEALADHTRLEELVGNAAQGTTLRRLLPTVTLFHYAGHGEFAGTGGWSSALPLADGSRLSLGDILTLPRAPAQVVLSGCETGRATTVAPLESLGLAQAFLVAGSRQVVATTRPVVDSDALQLITALYETADSTDTSNVALDFTQALRRAQLAWRAEDPTADWASFRVLVP